MLLSAKLVYTVANEIFKQEKGSSFNVQGMVNMRWAFTAAQRLSVAIFDGIGSVLSLELEQSDEIPKPQKFSNFGLCHGELHRR